MGGVRNMEKLPERRQTSAAVFLPRQQQKNRPDYLSGRRGLPDRDQKGNRSGKRDKELFRAETDRERTG